MVMTPSTAATTTAAARKAIAIRSRMPRAITGNPPKDVWTSCPFQIDTHEHPGVLGRTGIRPCAEYESSEIASRRCGQDTSPLDLRDRAAAPRRQARQAV